MKDTKRIQIRMTNENYDYLAEEAERTATNMSALASIIIADWIKAHKLKR